MPQGEISLDLQSDAPKLETNITTTEEKLSIRNLDNIFKPKRIAIVGIGMNPKSVGGKILSNLVTGGFKGVVYPVNPTLEAVMGIQCYPSVHALPNKPDLAILCAATESVPDLVLQCGEAGILGIIIVTAGFKETGEEGRILEERIKEIRTQYDGMRIMGPNCLGFIAPGMSLNASFGDGMPRKGKIAFVSQSGALCTAVLDWALAEKIGFSYFISIGNSIDVSFGDLIDYLGEEEETDSIILYIESISMARRFMTATRAFARSKPIIAYKAGRFPESAEVAASHTGALASSDDVYDAAFKRAGIARVYDIGKIFNVVELIGRKNIPQGDRLAIVTNAGGPGVMATDALIEAKGRLAELSESTLELLNQNLPAFWSKRNPVDVLGDARPKRISKALSIILNDKNVDAILVILTPQAMTNPTGTAKEIASIATDAKKPILAAWVGGSSMKEGMDILIEAGIATYSTPEQAIGAFMTLVAYARNLEALYETPKNVPFEFTLHRKEFRKSFDPLLKHKNKMLSEDISKALLESYGIPTTMAKPAASQEEAIRIAEQMGYPVVLKIHSQDISHKTDAGGVILNLSSKSEVSTAYDKILENARNYNPKARIEGVTVQPMINTQEGLELILGIKRDPVFGTVMMVGTGGIYAELFKDRALELPPLNEKLARRMLESLQIYPMLMGYRSKAGVNLDKLVEILIRMSYLAADYPEIAELDINPLHVFKDDVIALDCRVLIDPLEQAPEPYSHLALRPYPDEYVQTKTLKDGSVITLRPIKPEDEPQWLELLGSCSRESIYQRFRYFFHWDSHAVAIRYCFIDYDREIAIVAEVETGGEKKLVGIGRLVADPDHETVEYAVLVTDAWQNRGLGSLLTDACMEVTSRWNLKRVVAQTTS
ncbi:MAG: bifunctional acetate--CoA ligase family protein/GNAT family N-acetyltransferase, partial [Candidatus Cloacimonetes bacterium]|nr:bifunctional acetate--CoA ligase family protein/GNAT family N-acetyltransferase [Candidatus Cloacimonadota bacterium]